MSGPGNLIFDPEEVTAAKKIAVLFPGALAEVSIFDAADKWRDEGYALVRYRFPGLDGRPLHPPLNIAEAAEEVATFLRRYPGKTVRLLGYSTGGAIALTTAALVGGDLRVALMSCAVEAGGGIQTGLRGALDIAVAATRAGSLSRRAIWLEYYKTLLFGRHGRGSPQAVALIKERLDRIVMPEGDLPRAHTDDLRRWRLPDARRLPPAPKVRLFVGLEDPVFSLDQSRAMAARLGGAAVTGYAGQGHLLFLTEPGVFDDILAFFEDRDPPAGTKGLSAG